MPVHDPYYRKELPIVTYLWGGRDVFMGGKVGGAPLNSSFGEIWMGASHTLSHIHMTTLNINFILLLIILNPISFVVLLTILYFQ